MTLVKKDKYRMGGLLICSDKVDGIKTTSEEVLILKNVFTGMIDKAYIPLGYTNEVLQRLNEIAILVVKVVRISQKEEKKI